MNILVLGSGGRESAVVQALSKPGRTVYALPGNGGIEHCLPGSVMDKAAVLQACRENSISFCVVTPDDPLAIGMCDYLEANGIPCFGPDRKAARIESSKAFSKALMKKYGIPTAEAEVFSDLSQALDYIHNLKSFPAVIKADGLALGKGVVIARTAAEAEEALRQMMEEGRFGEAGRTVVIEEFLTGPEVSVLSFTDGRTIVPMVSSMDHKRAWDDDRGPNTGGMGTVAPNPYYTPDIAAECMERIFLPTIRAMESEGCPFSGCLYFGLMLTEQEPKVIEYNARFGDPETQVVLPLLESDLLKIMTACRNGTLAEEEVRFSSDSACCLVLASKGYPGPYEKGREITADPGIRSSVMIAGACMKDGRLVTSGGRVLGLVAKAKDLKSAVDQVYSDCDRIHFDGKQYRKDIGAKALEAYGIQNLR